MRKAQLIDSNFGGSSLPVFNSYRFSQNSFCFFSIYFFSFPPFHSLSHTPLSSQVCLPPTQQIFQFHYTTVNHCILVESNLQMQAL